MQTWVVGLRWRTLQSMLLQLNLLGLTQNSHTIQTLEEHLELVTTKEHTITLNSLQTLELNQVSTATETQRHLIVPQTSLITNTVAFDGNDIRIPQAAFTTRINVPPPGEIQISGSARTNAFDNNFITFDTTFETFDETGVTTLMSDTGITFDSSICQV